MSNRCHCHLWHSDMNTIIESAESDDKKNQMVADLNRCTCCAENRELRGKLAEYEETISNLEMYMDAIMVKQEEVFEQLKELRQHTGLELKEEESTGDADENPEQNGADNESLANGESEDEQWEVPCRCMCLSAISQTPSAAPSQPTSDSEGDFLEVLYRHSDEESDAN